MRLVNLFEEISRLDEAAIDRYLQMFSGVFNLLDAIKESNIQAAQAIQDRNEKHRILKMAEDSESWKSQITKEINWAMDTLKRQDRIVWYLRWLKLYVLSQLSKWKDLTTLNPELTQKIENTLKKDAIKIENISQKWRPQLDEQEAKLQEKIAKIEKKVREWEIRTGRTAEGADIGELNKLKGRLRAVQRNKQLPEMTSHGAIAVSARVTGNGGRNQKSPDLTHFMQMASMDQNIANLRFENQTPGGIETELKALEDEWRDKMARFIGQREVPERAEILLKFDDGSQWIDLKKPSCDIEARAMGHCGNVGATGETVLSYREPDIHPETREAGWIPRLTFILHSDGYLGEMKGYKNQKPSPAYHDKIVALLRLPIIRGIRGGGYLPENNFSMADLDEKTAEKLMDEKPGLATLNYIYRKNNGVIDDLLLEKLNDLLEEHGISAIDSYDPASEEFIIDSGFDTELAYDRYGGPNSSYDSEWYGNISDYLSKIIDTISDEVIRGIRNYVIEVYDAVPEERVPEENTQEVLTIEEVMEWSRDELFEFLDEEMDDVYSAIRDAIQENYKQAYESAAEFELDSIDEYGIEDMHGGFEREKVDEDGNQLWRLVTTKDEMMEQIVPKIEAGDYDNRSWSEILNLYISDVNERMHDDMSYDNDWFIEGTARQFEDHEDVKKAIAVGEEGLPQDESQLELEFGPVEVPPMPKRPEWNDYSTTRQYYDAMEKYKKDLRKWSRLVKKYGGEEHAAS